jgi:hypothetical protein
MWAAREEKKESGGGKKYRSIDLTRKRKKKM